MLKKINIMINDNKRKVVPLLVMKT